MQIKVALTSGIRSSLNVAGLKNLQQLRETLGYTRVEMAELVGISVDTVNNLERGRGSSSAHLDAIALATGCIAESLNSLDGPKTVGGGPYTRDAFDEYVTGIFRNEEIGRSMEVACRVLSKAYPSRQSHKLAFQFLRFWRGAIEALGKREYEAASRKNFCQLVGEFSAPRDVISDILREWLEESEAVSVKLYCFPGQPSDPNILNPLVYVCEVDGKEFRLRNCSSAEYLKRLGKAIKRGEDPATVWQVMKKRAIAEAKEDHKLDLVFRGEQTRDKKA